MPQVWIYSREIKGQFPVEYDDKTIILDIKQKLFDTFDIPVDKQTIIYCGRELFDNEQAYELKLWESAKLNMLVKKPKQEDRKEKLKGTLFDNADQQVPESTNTNKNTSKKTVSFCI